MYNNSMGGLYVPSANPNFQVIISDPKEGPRNDTETIEKITSQIPVVNRDSIFAPLYDAYNYLDQSTKYKCPKHCHLYSRKQFSFRA